MDTNNIPQQKCGFGITCLVLACIYTLGRPGAFLVGTVASRWGIRQMMLVMQRYQFGIHLFLIATIFFAMISFWKKEKPFLGCLGLLFTILIELICSVVSYVIIMAQLPPG